MIREHVDKGLVNAQTAGLTAAIVFLAIVLILIWPERKR